MLTHSEGLAHSVSEDMRGGCAQSGAGRGSWRGGGHWVLRSPGNALLAQTHPKARQSVNWARLAFLQENRLLGRVIWRGMRTESKPPAGRRERTRARLG